MSLFKKPLICICFSFKKWLDHRVCSTFPIYRKAQIGKLKYPLGIEFLERRLIPTSRPLHDPFLFLGSDPRTTSRVEAYNSTSGTLAWSKPVMDPAFTGGVHATSGDINQAVKEWLEETYPSIQKEAKKHGALIHWEDEMGVRSDHQAGKSYGRKGQSPVIPGTSHRFGCSMNSAITNRGELIFMVFQERFRGKLFLKFLGRLIRQRNEKIFQIVDGHPVHRSAAVKALLVKNKERIQMIRLPGYSPDLNPDELLHQDVKSNAAGKTRPSNEEEMIEGLRSYLRSTRKNPPLLKNYSRHRSVLYAAA